MSDHSRAGTLAHVGILTECRELVAQRLCETLVEALAEIDAELQEKRNKAGMNAVAQRYVEAQYYLRAAAPDFEQALRRAFERRFRARLSPRAERGRAYRDLVLEEGQVKLVDDHSMTEHLTVLQLARRMGRAVEGELQALQPRIATLMAQPDGEWASDPLGPEALCEALRDVCWDLGSGLEVRTLMLEQLAGKMSPVLHGLYQELNDYLESRQIRAPARHLMRQPSLPKAAPVAAVAPGPSPAASADPVPPAGGRDVAEACRAGVVRQLLSDGDLAGVDLAALRWSRPAGGAAATVGESSGEGRQMPVAGDGAPWPALPQLPEDGAQPVPFARGEVLGMLTYLQQAGTATLSGPAGAFSFVAPADATENMLYPLLDGGLAPHLEPIDGIIIDVVASLFEQIFDDRRVPDLMKGLLGRLQIPVLKLAMMDHAFLANRSHPARRLINDLAHGAATWGDGFDVESPLFRQAEVLVHRIQHEFADDEGVFERCLQELADFFAEQERRADEVAARMAAELARAEQEEIAAARARQALAQYLEMPDLPEVLADFLRLRWQQVLAAAALVEDDGGACWRAAMATLERLVWSVQPKRNGDERQQLVDGLPALLQELRTALESLEMGEDERNEFFAALVILHAVAVKAGLPQLPLPVELPPLAELPPPPPPPRVGATADVLEPEGISVPSVAASSPVERLSRGMWLDLWEEDGGCRHVRLTWISPAHGMYLFAQRQGEEALAIARNELEARFATGRAEVSWEQPLLDRIIDGLLAGCRDAAI